MKLLTEQGQLLTGLAPLQERVEALQPFQAQLEAALAKVQALENTAQANRQDTAAYRQEAAQTIGHWESLYRDQKEAARVTRARAQRAAIATKQKQAAVEEGRLAQVRAEAAKLQMAN